MAKIALFPLIWTENNWEAYKLKLKSETTTEISKSRAIKKGSYFYFTNMLVVSTAMSNLEVFINSGSSFFHFK